MGFLKIAQDPTSGSYFIEDNTDEELYVIAELLLNSEARAVAKGLIESMTQEHAKAPGFYMKKKGSDKIFITMYKKNEPLEEDNPLVIEMIPTNLDGIIDEWELFMLEQPAFLKLTRRHDSDIVELFSQES